MRRKKETRRKTQNPRQALFCRKERHNKTWRILTTVIRFILKEWRMISVNENSFNLNKNIFQISWNLIFIDIQLNKDGSLQSKHYTFDVGEVINSYNIDLFVNASSINQTYLHDKNPGDVINLYGTLDNIPLVVKECTGKNHQINVKTKLPQ